MKAQMGTVSPNRARSFIEDSDDDDNAKRQSRMSIMKPRESNVKEKEDNL